MVLVCLDKKILDYVVTLVGLRLIFALLQTGEMHLTQRHRLIVLFKYNLTRLVYYYEV